MAEIKRTSREIELTEEKLAAEIRKIEAETELAEFEGQEYARQERNAKAKHSESFIYNFLNEVNKDSVKSAIGLLTEWVRRKEQAGEDGPITVIFNSPGGNVFAGLALYDAIRGIEDHDGIEVITIARGVAASMAGVLLQAGHQRLISPNSWMLIHEITDMTFGTTSEVEDSLKLTQRLQKQLVEILATRSTKSAKQIEKEWKRKDWWLNAEEVVKLGFADKIG